MLTNIYFLDRNIVSLIRQSMDGKIDFNEEQMLMIDFIKKNDLPNVGFSIVLSAMEGEVKKVQTKNQFEKSLVNDGELIKSFFEYAKLDYNHYATDERFDGSELEEGFLVYCDFHRSIASFLMKDISVRKDFIKTVGVKEKIFKLANDLNISRSHPMIVLSLAALYGNIYAKKILKFHEAPKSTYNAVSDVMFLIRASMVAGLPAMRKSKVKTENLTLDKSLAELDKLINWSAVTNDSLNCVINVSYHKDLFSNLTETQYRMLNDELAN